MINSWYKKWCLLILRSCDTDSLGVGGMKQKRCFGVSEAWLGLHHEEDRKSQTITHTSCQHSPSHAPDRGWFVTKKWRVAECTTLKIYHFSIRIILSWKQLRKTKTNQNKTDLRKVLCPPIGLKAGQRLVKVSPTPFLPGKTEVNCGHNSDPYQPREVLEAATKQIFLKLVLF